MKKNKNTTQVINFLIQKQCKKQNSCFFKNANTVHIKLFYFLWLSKLIYGYTKINQNNFILFLKSRIKQNKKIYQKYNKMLTAKNLMKIRIWNKNNFFIINNNNNFLNLKQIKFLKIGSFISYKIS